MKNRYGLKRGPIPRLQSFWDARAACNFIGGGTGTGLIIVAALCGVLGQPVLALPTPGAGGGGFRAAYGLSGNRSALALDEFIFQSADILDDA